MNVQWTSSALDRLADVYVTSAAGERDELERAVLDINARLAIEPLALGESRRTDRRRVWFAYPFVVQFDALSDPARVIVFHVARLRPRTAEGE